ncbi:ROK family transcriptional regulator (plasmid) [Arthrobacter sp. ERGS1:01]|uniref:ROK family protein n=1 Tax=Arthrobacter sp. ERGS1:01 TaxID=1704044 RepID=UPI0006B4B942|nr:ROK family protein [Arthrobacter sp. ERGS1:01]ALE04529.1 ROK family transcriptional regulator [Arthrobacter sp. ERGS1:01]
MRYVVGVDLGGTKTAAGVIGEDGSVLLTDQVPTLNRDGGEAILDATAALVRSLVERVAAQGAVVDAVGIGSAGVINAAEGTVISATDAILGWTGTHITAGLAARLGLPAAVVNDVHAHAMGEAWLGAGAGNGTSLMVAFGTGVGGSFVVDGKPLLGHHFVGGHVGHFASPYAVDRTIPLPCSCGHSGHVEAIASGPAIHAAYVRNGGSTSLPDTRAVFDAARLGDELARSVIYIAASAAGQAVGGLVNILDPAVVVVSGGLADAGELWWTPMEAALRAELLAPLAGVSVVRASLGNTAAMVGAASLVLS